MKNTKVKELMTGDPVVVSPEASLKEAAAKMKSVDCGVLPVGTEDRLLGMITDRDIVIRAVAAGKDPAKEKVADYMTGKVYSCSEEDYLEDAADKMREHGVSRLMVKNRQGRVRGILSFGCILRRNANAEEVANVVKHAVRPAAV